MDTNLRTVMYIGSKSRKDDRPNGQPNRVWSGTGSIVEGIPPTQAAALVAHRDEFIDVTGFDTEALQKRAQQAIAEAGERRRQSRSGMRGSGGGVLLEYASEEQLLEELDKRRASRSLLADTTVHAPPKSDAQVTNEQLTDKQRSDKAFLADKVPIAIEAVYQKAADNPDLLDEEGVPTKLAVEEELGFQLTEDDFNEAVGKSAD